MTGAEALIRWRNEEGTFTSPGDFIPIFESNGMIVRLDEYVFSFVCNAQKELIEQGKKTVPISVNMSRNTLFHPGTINRYKKIIRESGIPAELVPIELTESAAINTIQIKELVNEIKKAGFVLHMDDFGFGYSSLAGLSMLPFDVVKLDKTLIDDIGNSGGEEILRHIIEMAHFFKMEAVAEGVEDRMQYNFLRKLDCDSIQGYYFSRPMPFENFLELLYKEEKGKGERDNDTYELAEDSSIGSIRLTNNVRLQYFTAIGSIYMTLHAIDLVNDVATEFSTTTNVKELVHKSNDCANQIASAMKGTVSPEYIDAALEFTDLTTLPARMRNKRTITAEFVGVHFGWFRARFITVTTNEKDEPTIVIFTTEVIESDKRKEAMLLRACRTDELTGVLNRRAFEEDIKTISDSETEFDDENKDLVAVMLDVNGLKKTNDTMGHAAGDELIWGVAECITKTIGKRGAAYRIGGDEFLAIFYADCDEVKKLEKAFNERVENWMGNTVRSLSVSYGVATRRENPELTITELIALADRRMYEAKASHYARNSEAKASETD